MWRATWLLALSVCCAGMGCSDRPDVAGHGGPLAKQPTKQPIGLEAIRERGVLRLLTRNNGATYFVLRGRPLGFDYEVAEKFAAHLGVKLEVVVPSNWGDLIPMLRAGEGDVIGAGMTVNEERVRLVAFAEPYALTHMRVVWGKGQKKIDYAEELSGKRVHVRRHSAYYGMLDRLSSLLERTGQAPVDIVIEGETMETEKILLDVAAGQVPYSLCDLHICQGIKAYSPNLVIGPPVSEPKALAWAVHQDAPDLLAELNAFLARIRGRELRTLYTRYYASARTSAERRRDHTYLDGKGRISRFDDMIRRAAEKYGFDWRLLASIAFQESRFNPKAATRSAGRGLFGMLPRTARALGVEDLHQPARAAEAAAAHLSAMRGEFSQVADSEVRLEFAVAAYQCGPGHVEDARMLTSKQGLDPAKWEDVAKILPLLSLREFAAGAAYGYVRGAQTVDYVEAIWERYRAYRHALGERDVRTQP